MGDRMFITDAKPTRSCYACASPQPRVCAPGSSSRTPARRRKSSGNSKATPPAIWPRGCLRQGEGVEVVAPAGLRKWVCGIAERVLGGHGDDAGFRREHWNLSSRRSFHEQMLQIVSEGGGTIGHDDTESADSAARSSHRLFCRLLPQPSGVKVELQRADRIRRLQSEGKTVAMVGDGSTMPCACAGHVGIALGTGTDIAMEAADINFDERRPGHDRAGNQALLRHAQNNQAESLLGLPVQRHRNPARRIRACLRLSLPPAPWRSAPSA